MHFSIKYVGIGIFWAPVVKGLKVVPCCQVQLSAYGSP